MIKEFVGDVFLVGAELICHQVNCKGVMGAGIAAQIKRRISDEQFEDYVRLCESKGSKNLGDVLYTLDSHKTIIANCFGQDDYGTDSEKTDYIALYFCMKKVLFYCKNHNISHIALPGMMGCGLAGGYWPFVMKNCIIPVFLNEQSVSLDIVYFSEEDYHDYAVFTKDTEMSANGLIQIPAFIDEEKFGKDVIDELICLRNDEVVWGRKGDVGRKVLQILKNAEQNEFAYQSVCDMFEIFCGHTIKDFLLSKGDLWTIN